jgi:hypothetical protein
VRRVEPDPLEDNIVRIVLCTGLVYLSPTISHRTFLNNIYLCKTNIKVLVEGETPTKDQHVTQWAKSSDPEVQDVAAATTTGEAEEAESLSVSVWEREGDRMKLETVVVR